MEGQKYSVMDIELNALGDSRRNNGLALGAVRLCLEVRDLTFILFCAIISFGNKEGDALRKNRSGHRQITTNRRNATRNGDYASEEIMQRLTLIYKTCYNSYSRKENLMKDIDN